MTIREFLEMATDTTTENNNTNTDELTTIRARRKTYVNTEF